MTDPQTTGPDILALSRLCASGTDDDLDAVAEAVHDMNRDELQAALLRTLVHIARTGQHTDENGTNA